MAQPATHPKIEELRFRLKTDPKSRLFYQLAEELRRAGEFAESEQVLRNGLNVYPTYLAAWVSLGRVLREQKKEEGAVEALNKALQLDPGNVVAARLLADAYLALGEKVEAIKKYKLVLALLPADEELRTTIDRIDRELQPPEVIAEPEPEVSPAHEEAVAPEEAGEEEAPAPFVEESPFDRTLPPFEEEMQREIATADVEPMSRAHDESPFEEPVSEFTAAALTIESPLGMHIAEAPLAAEVPAPVIRDEELPPIDDTPLVSEADDVANTITMADLYVRQGLVEDARHIYENILARHPGNADVREKLMAIAPRVNPKVVMLERWLAKVSRREVGRV